MIFWDGKFTTENCTGIAKNLYDFMNTLEYDSFVGVIDNANAVAVN